MVRTNTVRTSEVASAGGGMASKPWSLAAISRRANGGYGSMGGSGRRP